MPDKRSMPGMCILSHDHANGKNCEKPMNGGCKNNWTWSKRYRSQEAVLEDETFSRVQFHPNWSKGTAAIRGTQSLNNKLNYWEIHVSNRIFGTSMMFGIGTDEVRLDANKFINLLGEDENSWGLSHKGIVCHGGDSYTFTKRFIENQATKIGLLFDGINGTLTYYKDGRCLGVAFRGINKMNKPIYPVITSTAAKTEMYVTEQRHDISNLQDRCRAVILKHIQHKEQLEQLELPEIVTDYLAEAMGDESPLRPYNPRRCHCKYCANHT